MQYTLSDKIAILLAWVLVHTVIGIGFTHLYTICDGWLQHSGAIILNMIVVIKWTNKMIAEAKAAFGF